MEILETLPADLQEDVSEESPGEIPAVPPASPPLNNADFEERVGKLVALMENDPNVERRIIAEIYVNMASAEMGIRGVFDAIQTQGISGLMRGAFKRGK